MKIKSGPMILLPLSFTFLLIAHASAKTEVIYFGGYAASKKQMECWEKGARANTDENHGYTYRGLPWPAGTPSGPASAVAGNNRSWIKSIVDEIAKNPTTHYIIAGHSSGAAFANQVAREVGNPKQIELADLDGFAADPALQKRVKTKCWYAERKDAQGKVLASSRNAGSMKNCKDSEAFINRTCDSGAKMCLHFALVNKSAPKDLGMTDFASRGYEGCSTNLKWVPAPTAVSTSAPFPSMNGKAGSQ